MVKLPETVSDALSISKVLQVFVCQLYASYVPAEPVLKINSPVFPLTYVLEIELPSNNLVVSKVLSPVSVSSPYI